VVHEIASRDLDVSGFIHFTEYSAGGSVSMVLKTGPDRDGPEAAGYMRLQVPEADCSGRDAAGGRGGVFTFVVLIPWPQGRT
jgi:hypothetical protein